MSIESSVAEQRFTVDRQALVERLRAVLPAQALLVEEEEMRPYDCDGLTAYRQLPLIVALPADEAQAQAILKICYELKVPVVARGAATGLSGRRTACTTRPTRRARSPAPSAATWPRTPAACTA
jgi:hypothetical protein